MFHPDRPHNDLSPLPPQAEIETRPVLKKWGLARTALAELRLAGQTIPDQSVLISVIPLLEAKDSSEIENIVTTNDALFREASLGDDEGDPAAKEALKYRAALYHGLDTLSAKPLSARTAVEICRLLTGIDLDVRNIPVTLSNRHTGEVIYTPPQEEARLRGLLANWETYLHADEDGLDPLIRMAILHYQFEAIHPFPDGNGRTGRILNVLTLIESGLLDLPTLYLSRYILRTRGDYYRLLGRVTSHGEWEAWVLYMLDAVQTTSSWTTGKIRAIRTLMEETHATVRDRAQHKVPRELIDLIFTQPYCRIANVVEKGIAKRQAASTYLKELARLGILEEEKVGRDKLFLHRKYFDLLQSEAHGFAPYEPASEKT
ncbi:MAG TPA: Fic/DOC family N-terminal domain-containing protein [Hyphomicrobium sp.]|nr:Fic/DOC family N-terminal domain-containing protein [Hyphomicrobium sp.]HRO51084.1 Fic/DOC family N-terminal domain-containing protein [Hyphomicrobium sp.]